MGNKEAMEREGGKSATEGKEQGHASGIYKATKGGGRRGHEMGKEEVTEREREREGNRRRKGGRGHQDYDMGKEEDEQRGWKG